MFLYFPHIRSLYSTHFCTPGEGEDNVSLLNIMCTINDRPSPELPRVKTVHQPKENKTKQNKKQFAVGLSVFVPLLLLWTARGWRH